MATITYIDPDHIMYQGHQIKITHDAQPSSRLFGGCWQEAKDGEAYIAEWTAYGTDDDDNDYLIRWQFDDIRRDGEIKDPSDYPWDDTECMSVELA